MARQFSIPVSSTRSPCDQCGNQFPDRMRMRFQFARPGVELTLCEDCIDTISFEFKAERDRRKIERGDPDMQDAQGGQ